MTYFCALPAFVRMDFTRGQGQTRNWPRFDITGGGLGRTGAGVASDGRVQGSFYFSG
jgi:hypothetical protein